MPRPTAPPPTTSKSNFSPEASRCRAALTPGQLRTRPERDPEQVTGGQAPDGLVLGDRVTISGALFDPRTGAWTDLPAPPDREPSGEQPSAAHQNVTRMGYRWIGGPHDIVRYRQGDIVTTGTDPGPFTVTATPGQVAILENAA